MILYITSHIQNLLVLPTSIPGANRENYIGEGVKHAVKDGLTRPAAGGGHTRKKGAVVE